MYNKQLKVRVGDKITPVMKQKNKLRKKIFLKNIFILKKEKLTTYHNNPEFD